MPNNLKQKINNLSFIKKTKKKRVGNRLKDNTDNNNPLSTIY